MDDYIKELEEKIEELKTWRDQLETQATREAWTRRVGYFMAGWGFYKLISRKSTMLSNIIMGSGFLMGYSAGSNIDALGHNYSIAVEMIQEREEELEKIKKLNDEQKESQKKGRQLVLETVKDEQ